MAQAKRITLISAFVLLVGFGTYMLAARPFSPTKDEVAVEPNIENVQEVEATTSTTQSVNNQKTQQLTQKEISSTEKPVAIAKTSSITSKTCRSGDLEGQASLQSIGSTVVGIFKLSARNGVNCTLAGYPIVSIVDKRGTLSGTTYFLSAGPNVALKSGESATSRVIWSNWCGRSVSDLSLRVSLTGNKGYLLIPAISAAGKAQSMTPSCIDSHASTTLSVTGFAK